MVRRVGHRRARESRKPKRRWPKHLPLICLGFAMAFGICYINRRPDPAQQAPTTVSYKDALANPKVRQSYLDKKAKEWKNGCFSSLVYDPDYKKAVAEIKRKASKYRKEGKGHLVPDNPVQEFLRNASRPGYIAANIAMPPDFAGGERPPIFVYRNAFEIAADDGYTEKRFWELIVAHEGKHACDQYHGLKIDGRGFTAEELFDARKSLKYAIEARAYAEQMKQWDWKTIDDFKQSMSMNFFVNVDSLIIQELSLTRGWENFNGRMPSRKEAIERIREKSRMSDDDAELFIARRTVLGCVPTIELLTENRLMPWEIRDIARIRDGTILVKKGLLF